MSSDLNLLSVQPMKVSQLKEILSKADDDALIEVERISEGLDGRLHKLDWGSPGELLNIEPEVFHLNDGTEVLRLFRRPRG